LTPSDRLCIITFNNWAKRLTPLKALTKENISELNDVIKSIQSGGGTNILSGMEMALKVMR
jgi:Mg-chelatase subunit ChlD